MTARNGRIRAPDAHPMPSREGSRIDAQGNAGRDARDRSHGRGNGFALVTACQGPGSKDYPSHLEALHEQHSGHRVQAVRLHRREDRPSARGPLPAPGRAGSRQLVLRRAGHHSRRAEGPLPPRRVRDPERGCRRPPGHPRRPGRRGRGRGMDGRAVAALLAGAGRAAPAPVHRARLPRPHRPLPHPQHRPDHPRRPHRQAPAGLLQPAIPPAHPQRDADRRVHRRPRPGDTAVGAERRRPGGPHRRQPARRRSASTSRSGRTRSSGPTSASRPGAATASARRSRSGRCGSSSAS